MSGEVTFTPFDLVADDRDARRHIGVYKHGPTAGEQTIVHEVIMAANAGSFRLGIAWERARDAAAALNDLANCKTR